MLEPNGFHIIVRCDLCNQVLRVVRSAAVRSMRDIRALDQRLNEEHVCP